MNPNLKSLNITTSLENPKGKGTEVSRGDRAHRSQLADF